MNLFPPPPSTSKISPNKVSFRRVVLFLLFGKSRYRPARVFLTLTMMYHIRCEKSVNLSCSLSRNRYPLPSPSLPPPFITPSPSLWLAEVPPPRYPGCVTVWEWTGTICYGGEGISKIIIKSSGRFGLRIVLAYYENVVIISGHSKKRKSNVYIFSLTGRKVNFIINLWIESGTNY